MTDGSNPSEWITTAEAAELTGYHAFHIRRLVRAGHIDGAKFGRDWLVNRKSAQAYAEHMKRLGSAKHNPTKTRE